MKLHFQIWWPIYLGALVAAGVGWAFKGHNDADLHVMYNAFIKITHNTNNLTFDEWRLTN